MRLAFFGGDWPGTFSGTPHAERATSRAVRVMARLGLRIALYILPARCRAGQNRRLRVRGIECALEPVHGCGQLIQALDGSVGHAVVGVAATEVYDPHIREPCPLDVEPDVVAHVHGVLGGYAEALESLVKDTGGRLANAALVREDHAGERVEQAFVLEDSPQHGAGRSQRV